jgi:hypothetical protein
MSLSTTLQVECRFNVLLEAEEMFDVGRDGLAEEKARRIHRRAF